MTFFEKIICVFTTQKYFNAILSGLKTTVCITFFSVCIGLVIGTGVAFVKVSQKYIRSVKWLQPICDAYMVIVTHEMRFAQQVASRVIFFDGGKIVEENTPQEFFNNPKNERLKEFLSKLKE